MLRIKVDLAKPYQKGELTTDNTITKVSNFLISKVAQDNPKPTLTSE